MARRDLSHCLFQPNLLPLPPFTSCPLQSGHIVLAVLRTDSELLPVLIALPQMPSAFSLPGPLPSPQCQRQSQASLCKFLLHRPYAILVISVSVCRTALNS